MNKYIIGKDVEGNSSGINKAVLQYFHYPVQLHGQWP
jgi:hypothetical protein